MIFPDCRNDDCYNENFLNRIDKTYISGMDYMLEQIVNLFENNLKFYKGKLEVDTDADIDKILDKAKMEISAMIKEWAESERNMTIVSMIDNMDNTDYKENRKKVLTEHPNEYYNTKRFMWTGKKFLSDMENDGSED